MAYLGDIRLGDTIDFHFTTRQISGAPSTLSSSPVLSAYPSNSTTELTAGITLDVDFDSRTGLNHVRVVASNGNGYATATDYSMVITTGTVNSVSVVGEVVGNFSIEHRSALMPATAARTLVVDAAGLGDANMVKAGASGSGNTITTSGGVTLPAATLASTTNITAGTITTTTNLTNLPAITNNWLTAAGIAASALNGKGDWLLSSSYTAPPTTAQIATGVWTDTTAGDFTTALSVGKSVMNGVSLGTGLTVAAVSGAVGSVTGNVGGNVVGSVASVTAGVTVTTNSDKTGYSLTQTFPSNFSALAISAGGLASADVKKINAVTVNGVGTAGNPWGP